jgi:hypothetical protein
LGANDQTGLRAVDGSVAAERAMVDHHVDDAARQQITFVKPVFHQFVPLQAKSMDFADIVKDAVCVEHDRSGSTLRTPSAISASPVATISVRVDQ